MDTIDWKLERVKIPHGNCTCSSDMLPVRDEDGTWHVFCRMCGAEWTMTVAAEPVTEMMEGAIRATR